MGETRERIVAFLRGEQGRLQAELDEVVLLLEVLVEPGVETGAEDYGVADRPETLPVVEKLPVSENGKHAAERMKEIAAENVAAIIRVLGYDGPGTPQTIAETTGISRGTVQQHLKALHAAGRVTRVPGPRAMIGGRKPYLYTLVPIVEPREHTLDLRTRVVED